MHVKDNGRIFYLHYFFYKINYKQEDIASSKSRKIQFMEKYYGVSVFALFSFISNFSVDIIS